MLARPGRAAALAGLLVIVAVCGPTIAEAADPADDGQTLDVRRLSSDQRRRLLAGETITYAVPETSDVELAAGVAMYLPVPLARAAEVLTSSDLVLSDATITASGPIAADGAPLSLRGFTLAAGELGEAQEVLDATPGSRFNLSAAEIDSFRAARAAVRPGDRGSVLEAAASQWRVTLLERAGVDMRTSGPFKAAMAEMNRIMDEMERILSKRQ